MHLPQGGGPAALGAVIGAVPAARWAEPGPSPPPAGPPRAPPCPSAVRSAEPSAPGSGQGSAAGGGSRAPLTAQTRRQAGLAAGINVHALKTGGCVLRAARMRTAQGGSSLAPAVGWAGSAHVLVMERPGERWAA